jgi:hypothetical protein
MGCDCIDVLIYLVGFFGLGRRRHSRGWLHFSVHGLRPSDSGTTTVVVPRKMLESFASILDAEYLPLMSFIKAIVSWLLNYG